jgi:integrase/recombinase XerD
VSAEHLTLHVHKSNPLDILVQAFLLAKQAQRCTAKTQEHYSYTLGAFTVFLKSQGVQDIKHVTPTHIRSYLVSLQRRGLKDTTQHAHARGVKAWLNWLAAEGDLDESPMKRVAMPKLEGRIPPPFTREDIGKLLAVCNTKTVLGGRNAAIVLTLLDTGLRAAEFCSLRIGDVNMRTGVTLVMGKGQKQRQVRIGNKARGAILRMLAYRSDARPGEPLWMAYSLQTRERGALSVHGLQSAIIRLGRAAGVRPCGPHRFRRTFALWCLRDGMDLEHLRKLMGHSTLAVLQRYLALTGEDIERAHAAHSPADNML